MGAAGKAQVIAGYSPGWHGCVCRVSGIVLLGMLPMTAGQRGRKLGQSQLLDFIHKHTLDLLLHLVLERMQIGLM